MKTAVCLLFVTWALCINGQIQPRAAVGIPKILFRSTHDGSNDGRYTPDNSGAYNKHDGKYYPDDSGKYVHNDVKYQHLDIKYQHATDNFKNNRDRSRLDTAINRGVEINPVGGFGEPVELEQGSAAGKYDNRNYRIIRKIEQVENDGYHYLYETENGILAEEEGKLVNRGTDDEAMKAHGFFTYTGPDSIVYNVRYTADENGFVPEAAHLPTPPPIPAAIQRALDYQRSVGTLRK